MKTDNEKNINLTLKSAEETKSSLTISFFTIFRQIKRVISLWIVISIICALITTSFIIFFNKSVKSNTITALVSFNYPGVSQGLDPDGKKLDVNKIKSPNIIEKALTDLNEPLVYVERIRRNITIDGILPGETYDKMALYKSIFEQGGTAGLNAVNALLKIEPNPSYFIIEFNNNNAQIDVETGKKIINSMLDNYQEYFFATYGYNSALGNSVVAVDYTEYDYPASVDIFKTLLDSLDTYTRNLLENADTNFRSNETGYSFEDIIRTIETIESADLYPISSYITIYNVTNDKDQLITYYEYKIEEHEREATVIKRELDSISNSISNYEKDSMLIFGDNDNIDETEYSQVSEKYDQLIEEKIAVQQQYSAKNQQIEYYKTRLKTFKDNNIKHNADIEYVETKLSDLYDKICNLIEITEKTSDEYYENIVFANAFNILVPASGNESQVQIGGIIVPVITAEVLVFVVFIIYAFVSSIIIDSTAQKKKMQKKQADDDTQSE